MFRNKGMEVLHKQSKFSKQEIPHPGGGVGELKPELGIHAKCSNHLSDKGQRYHSPCHRILVMAIQIARFMGPTWDPPGADRTQMGPMLAPWTLLSRDTLVRQLHILETDGDYRIWLSKKHVCQATNTNDDKYYSTGLPLCIALKSRLCHYVNAILRFSVTFNSL